MCSLASALTRLLIAEFGAKTEIIGANRQGTSTPLPEDTFDVIFSTIPNTMVLQESLSCLTNKGRLIFIATTRPDSPKLSIDPLNFYRKDLSIHGVNSINLDLTEVKLLMDRLTEVVNQGLDLTYLADTDVKTFALDDAVAAYEAAAHSKQNIIVVPRS